MDIDTVHKINILYLAVAWEKIFKLCPQKKFAPIFGPSYEKLVDLWSRHKPNISMDVYFIFEK